MRALSRASRLRDPRATLGSSVLLFVAFVLFGVWATSFTEVDASLHPAAGVAHVLDELRAACPDVEDIIFHFIPRIE